MNKDTICLSSQTIDIAENENYLELTNRVCFYDEPNLNRAMLSSDIAEEKAKTLINMPVVAKYKVNSKGEPTFGSHEMYVDEEGDVCFATENIGTHTEVYIQEDSVDVNGNLKTLPCLFAKYRVWKRNKNVIAAIRRLFAENKLFSSWEIATSAYEFKDGIKKLTDYVFLSNCLLGFEYASPAYGKDAKAISLSTEDSQLLIAEALSQDLIEGLNIDVIEKEDEQLAKTKTAEVLEEVVEEISTEEVNATENIVVDTNPETEAIDNSTDTNTENIEQSALTEWDLRDKIREACRNKVDAWCWITYHFPVDKTVWVEVDGRESELDFVLFTYDVVNDEVTVSEPQNVKLTVSISEVNNKIDTLQSEIDAKNDALVKACEEIKSLTTQVSELTPFKEQFEKAEQERITNELSEKKKNLVSQYLKSGLITEEEFETSDEIKGYIDTFNEAKLKDIVATRYMASRETINVDTSEVKETKSVTPTASANLLDEEEIVDKKAIMKKFLNKH